MATRPATPQPLVTRDEAIQSCAVLLAHCADELGRMTPEAVAEQAYVPGGPSREVIAARFRELRDKCRATAA